MNRITISGRLGSDPKFTVTKDGKTIAKFNVAVTRRSNRELTDWFNCVSFSSAINEHFLKPFLHRGDMVICSGEFQFNEYDKKDGTKGTSTCIVISEIDICNSNKSANLEDETIENKEEEMQPIPDQDLPF